MMTDDLKKRKAIENYWLKRLRGDPPRLSLPVSNIESPGDTTGKAAVQIPVPESVSRGLMEIANHSDMGLFILFFSGLNLVIARYTGLEDLVIGTTTPRREGVKKEKLLLCRNTVSSGDPFKKVLNRIKRNVLEDFNHTAEEYSFGILYQRLLEKSGKDSLELFNVACFYDKLQNKSKQLRQFDLVFALSHEENQLVLTADYNTGLYSEEIIRRFCRNLLSVLEHLRELPEQKVSEIDILCAEELRELLDFNKTHVDYPRDKTIHRLFEEQVDRTPDQTAVIDIGKRLTYRELNEKANRMAHLLREKGVGPGTIVAILRERSVDTVVGLLGIMKAGGAYLPIDPSMPKNRILTMLSDSRATFLFTENHILHHHGFTALQGLKEKRSPIIRTPRRKQLADLDTLPLPDRSMVNYEKYNQYIGQVMVKNVISLQTARGCPFDCVYCSKIWSRKHVFRSAEEIFKEMKVYYGMGFRRFSIFDDIFNINAANGMKLFETIIKSGLDVQLFFPNGLRGDLLSKEYIDLLVEAGLASTALALETASPRLQKMINKNLNLEKFSENVEYFCEKHPHVLLELFSMHGFPTETKEEARMTMDFIKQQRWLHFPYVFILKIYPDTGMADLAMKHGVLRQDILKCEDLAFHELSPTSPFESSFTKNYQAEFLNEYFLLKERLRHVLPFQAKVLTKDEIVQKYDSYLPFDINCFEDILGLAGIKEEEVNIERFREEEEFAVPDLNRKLREYFPVHRPAEDAMRVLFLDLSQYFTHDTDMLYDVVEPPLGAMYVMAYLKEQLGDKVNGKIARSRIDFDSYDELKTLFEEFRPDVIGVRSLTFYRDFFHQTVGMLRLWGFEGPVIAGGPYATRNTETLLQDKNIDLLVVSEGEATFLELIKKIMENGGALPGESELKDIAGIAYAPCSAAGARDILVTDLLEDRLAKCSTADPEYLSNPSDMAYIIFTSGSAGKPKGVIINHRSAVNVLTWFARTYNIQPDVRVIQLTNYTFDPSVEQIFSTLLHGAELYIGKRELTADKEAFREFVNEHQIHVINFVPGSLKHLLEDEEPLQSLRTVISGGEKLEEDLKNRIIKKGYPLYNQYGPTETTIDALMEKCSEAKVTLGRPIANVQCYILQANNTLAPIGVKGELCIGGAGVARGYLNNPKLTMEKFDQDFQDLQDDQDEKKKKKRIDKNPLTSLPLYPSTSLYRTGDLARWLPNGTIEFIGRMDHQIKIRGLRIELGEIEAHLLAHSKIKEAVVNPVEVDREADDTQLCGYIVSDLELTPTELRDYLAMELPEYMIPAHFVRLEKLPLNSNGKLDRNALPEPKDTTTDRAVEYVAPETELEKRLAEIWTGVLGKKGVGVNENFFGLGGDSVKAIQILSRMNNSGYKVEMTDIFQYPTISQLAPLVTAVEQVADQSVVKGTLPLIPVQEHFFLHHKRDPHHFNQAVMLHSREGFEEAAVREIFTRIQAHHDALRMTYKTGEGGVVIQTNRGLDMPLWLEVEDLRGQETAVEILENKANTIQTSIDLENGPLMKLGLFHMENGDRLLIVIHHMVIDGISWRILFEDINNLYSQYKKNKRGESLELPKKTDSFKVWAEKLSQYAVSESLLEKRWWKQMENTDVPRLPVDFDTTDEIKVEDAFHLSVSLDENETRRLLTDVNEAFNTEINDILLTALGLALKETFHLDRFLITLEGHGREDILNPVEVTRTVGWFTTLFPVILDLSYAGDLARQVKEIKDHLHRMPNRGIGYGILRYLTPAEHKEDIVFKHEPRISFNYLGQFDADLEEKSFGIAAESPGQTVSPYSLQEFDLEVSGIISGNCLSISIAYNRKQYKTHTVETLINYFKTKLEQIIVFCSEREKKELTPSDMDYKGLSVKELGSIFG